ncbi:type II toxin-antitoxin system ParD family antitoxin [Niveispirillum sp. KHB5.9]|uniref:type II toxin-antitoxin system ParD family antitoxin n=1 Tax=Niveispirillum sp. KHB5.9 TaxID=3400269 RepID=UPI003A8371DF
MKITLPPALQEFIRQKVETGEYPSESGVVQAALGYMQHATDHERLEALRRAIQAGVDSGSAGPLNLEEMLVKARERYAARHTDTEFSE